MERVDRILGHPTFRTHIARLEALEARRVYCRHGLEHLLSVARLMRIKALETGAAISIEVIYAAALLHDLGRVEQYTDGTPHDAASVLLAEPVLTDCGFAPEERAEILDAIGGHRTGEGGQGLGALLYWADKASRPCYACPAREGCNWPEEKMNLTLEY